MIRSAQTRVLTKQACLAVLSLLAITFSACGDSGGSSATGSFTQPPTGGGGTTGNSAPVINSTAPTAATVGQLYSYQAAASDANGDTLTWSLSTGPTGLTISTGGLVSWTPNAGQVGSHNVQISVSDGQVSAQQTFSITVTAGGGSGGLPASVTLTDLGALPNGMVVISDMQEFDGKLYMAAAVDPLNIWGGGIYYYNGTSVQTALYDSTSQGFVRAKVYGGKLYVPDSDPNGLAPGLMYSFSAGSTTPLQSTITGAVHNFDVVEFNGQLYTSGSNNSGQSTLNRLNTTTGVWDSVSTGSYGRLKYMGVLDGKIWTSKQVQAGVDGVWVESTMVQQGFVATTSGGSLIPCIEQIDGKLYMTVWGSAGISKFIVNAGSTTTAITGIAGVMWDVIKHSDGNYYAVAWDGTNDIICGSTDGIAFVELSKVAGTKFGQPGSNADGRPSIASYNGKVYVGSSTNGRLYRLD